MNEVSKFSILGQIIHIKDAQCRNDLFELKTLLNVNSDSRIITVGKNSAMYSSINDAIEHALTLEPSTSNPITILISDGEYEEQIVLNDVHGINFVGFSKRGTIIKYNGSYPDCTVHVQGDVSFNNLTIKGLNTTTYAVHSDVLNTNVTGVLHFNNCIISGGSSAIGYGSGNDVELFVENCVLSGNDAILYAHNSSYPLNYNQRLTVINNLFLHGSETYCVRIDDAGYSNGGVTSQMKCIFKGNVLDYQGFGKIQFRKATAIPSTYTTYLPINDTNIICGVDCSNNGNIVGLNYGEGKYDISAFVVMPSEISYDGKYRASIPISVYGYNYLKELNDVTIPGIGSITSSVSIDDTSNEKFLFLSTTNANVQGRTLSVSITLTCL